MKKRGKGVTFDKNGEWPRLRKIEIENATLREIKDEMGDGRWEMGDRDQKDAVFEQWVWQ